jgi:PKD repeat protein
MVIGMACLSHHEMLAQCPNGTLPLVFQFNTCCVDNISNLVAYTIYNDAEEVVGQATLDISGAPAIHDFELCLPEGCYYTTLSYTAGFGTSAHLSSFEVVGENTSSFNIFQTSQNIPFSFGFCVTGEPIVCQAAFVATVENDGVVSVVNNSTPTDGFTSLFGWDFGDGGNIQGVQPDHTYLQNGVYEICLFQALYEGDIPVCVSEYCQTIEMNTVPDNSGCPNSLIVGEGNICGNYLIEHNATNVGTNYWFVDDALVSTANVLEQSFLTQGSHQICLAHVSPTCESSTTVCAVIDNPDCSNSNCPTEITYERTGCHTYEFYLNNLGNFGNMSWDFGDGATAGGQNNVTHTFDTLGVYTICVMAYGTFCQSGVEVCVSLAVEPCGGVGNGCQGEIYRTYEDECGHVHFEAGTNPSNLPVSWDFGDGTNASTAIASVDHYYTSPGVYTAIAQIANEACPNNATAYVVVVIEDCFNTVECPTDMFAASTNDCTMWNFEIGNVSPGESVIWDFGDGEVSQGGHFIEHNYIENGTYVVCGQYSSNSCPEGIEICNTIIVDCGLDCALEIQQLPTSCGLAIFQANTNVNSAEVHWSFDGVNTGLVGNIITLTATDGTYPLCAWYNSASCASEVEYCALTTIDNCNTCTELSFGFDSFMNNGGTSYLQWSIYNAQNLNQVENGMAQFSSNDPYFDTSVCLEDGCYVITAMNNSPFSFDAVIPQIGSNADIISIDTINLVGSYGYEILISVNGNCQSDCDIAGFSYVSYPSYGGMPIVNWSLTNSSDQLIANGSYDFTPMEVSQSYYDCLQEDCYTLEFTGNQPFDGNSNFVHYFSGSWNVVSTEFGNNGEQHTMTVRLSVNSNCNPIECNLSIEAQELEPGIFEFTATGTPEVYPMMWDFGDNQMLEATWVTMHEYAEPGEYTICGSIQTDACGIIEACTNILVTNNSICDYSIWFGPGTECGDFIFEIPGGNALGPIVWNFGNETVTDNQSLIHHFDEEGVYIVTASGSTNACPNFEYIVTIEAPACDSCSNVVAVFQSNVLEGSTSCVGMSFTNLQTNETTNQIFEFTANIDSVEWSECLLDGCYSISFDSCLPIFAGSGLDFDLFVNGVSILDNALISYQDSYAMTFTFGINSDCFSTNCEANFEVVTGNEPGQIIISNLSNVAGEANYTWNYGNEDINEGDANVYTYMQNGNYEICLTATNNLCEDTYCTAVEINNTLCNETGITVTLTSEYQQANMSDALTVYVTVEDNVIGQYILTVEPFNNYPLAFCVPDGCYNVELISNEPLEALGIFANVVSNNMSIGEAEILFGSYYGSDTFGINSDCVDAVNERTDSAISIFPNPSSNYFSWNIPYDMTIQQIILLDATGRLVRSVSPNDRSIQVADLSAGLYYMQFVTTKGMVVSKIEIQH